MRDELQPDQLQPDESQPDESQPDELQNLEALVIRREEAIRRRRELEELRRQLDYERISYDTPEQLDELAELADTTVQTPSFKERFCRLYNQRITGTISDIGELVVEIAFASNIPVLLGALIIIKFLRLRLDDYCGD
ncbi:hypothetical protein [Gloeothece verrucosa]|uniref:Uncharacterized protein n=1 Tax=Gloeothece verrucosa (strain PCC 7822) TaxID=497965 RepID=E0UKK6_GLOV7|nr:hypothetical protein [Gloeothece verrucosa]ADN17486.1 hypothetical protein Cyan7822_5620 [Gloeothece verrucosa PCC 7822]